MRPVEMRRLVLCAVLALLMVACGGGGGRPDVAAQVEGTKISSTDTEALVDAYRERAKGSAQKEDLPREALAKLVLGYQIKLAFVAQLAKQKGVTSEPEEYFEGAAGAVQSEAFQAIGLRKEDFAKELRAGRLSKALAEKVYPNVTVSETAVREEYDRRAEELSRNWKATAQVAVFATQADAAKTKEAAAQGKAFKESAETFGAGQISDVEINPVVAGLPPALLDTVGAMKSGDVSDPIGSGNGWFLIFLRSRQEVPKLTFEELRPELEATLLEAEQARLFQEWFDKQFEKAKVTVDGHYGDWDAKTKSVL